MTMLSVQLLYWLQHKVMTTLKQQQHIKWNPYKQTPLRSSLCLEYGGIRISGASDILPVGMVMCSQAVEHDKAAFFNLSIAVQC